MADVGVGRRGATTSWAAARMAAEEGPMELRNVNAVVTGGASGLDRKSTRLNSSHSQISYAVFCLKKKSTRLNSSHSQISYVAFSLQTKFPSQCFSRRVWSSCRRDRGASPASSTSICRNRAPVRQEKSRASSSSSRECASSWRRPARRSVRPRSPPWSRSRCEHHGSAGSAEPEPANRQDCARLDPGGRRLRDRHRGMARPRHRVSRAGGPPTATDRDRPPVLGSEERALEPGHVHVQEGARGFIAW